MKQAIVNFCKSMDTGLFLLDMPTGFGKTYSVLDFMVDNYDAPELSKKKLNVRYIHDKSFYSDSEVDPHQESMEDYVVQHITVTI